MIFIANKQNQVTARHIENEKPIGWKTKNFLYVALFKSFFSYLVCDKQHYWYKKQKVQKAGLCN